MISKSFRNGEYAIKRVGQPPGEGGGRSRLYGILAYPAKHSLSPAMMNAAFKALGIDACFEVFEVLPEKLGEFIKTRTDVDGLAVSIPHKESIIPYLDGLDSLAERIGAVNTVYLKGGKRWGANTDALGFSQALKEVLPALKGKRALVLGAGGAARAVITVLREGEAEVLLWNRTIEKAKKLGEKLGVDVLPTLDSVDASTIDLVVNTTSVGLDPKNEIPLITSEFWKPAMVAFDLVYRPANTNQTLFLKSASAAGAYPIDGKKMLLVQGMRQFELWTGQSAPEQAMESVLYTAS